MNYVVGAVGAALTIYAVWLQAAGNRRQEQLARAFGHVLQDFVAHSTKEEIATLTAQFERLEAQIRNVPANARRVFLEERRRVLARSIGELYDQYESTKQELMEPESSDPLEKPLRAAIESEIVPEYVARQRQQRLVYTCAVTMVVLYVFPTIGNFVRRLLFIVASSVPLEVSTEDVVSYTGGVVLFVFLASLIPHRAVRIFLTNRTRTLSSIVFSLAGWFGSLGITLHPQFIADSLPYAAPLLLASTWFFYLAFSARKGPGTRRSLWVPVAVGALGFATILSPVLRTAAPSSAVAGLTSMASLVMLASGLRCYTHYLMWGTRKV